MGCSGSKKEQRSPTKPARQEDGSQDKLKWQGALLVQQAHNRIRALQDVQGTGELLKNSKVNIRGDASDYSSTYHLTRTNPETLLSQSELNIHPPSAPSSCVVFIPGDYTTSESGGFSDEATTG
eukprot:TRINITY_DN21617_c0_g1_i1.p1 TRINITY_DN21617_c0_g1~~TRINITY_DN21617_c0_g1_i1.p1  ORF type:complete len:124 (+),score=9.69 TRINITY_DN21617_c0_g1_i1:55-426(+)